MSIDNVLLILKKPVLKDELQCSVVGLTRFELVTSRLSVVRSDQLSYRPALKALGYITTTRNNFATTFFNFFRNYRE